MAYALDFREKVPAYCKRTGRITEASDVFQISRHTIYGWLKLKEKTGNLNHHIKSKEQNLGKLIEIASKTILLIIRCLFG